MIYTVRKLQWLLLFASTIFWFYLPLAFLQVDHFEGQEALPLPFEPRGMPVGLTDAIFAALVCLAQETKRRMPPRGPDAWRRLL